MSTLRLQLLGPPRIQRDGVALRLKYRKNIALVAYLAATGEPHTREALITLLWPDLEPSRALANLRRNLSVLRKGLGDEWLVVEGDTVGLNPSADVQVDVERFRNLLQSCQEHGYPEPEVCPECLSALAEAVELYRDDFLAGFTLPDSAAFDEWQFFETEGLRQELAAALKRLVRGHSDRGAYEAAIPHARRWVALGPLHEPAHRELMALYAKAGQRAAALRQYQECMRILEVELGLAPSEETLALYERIRAARPAAADERGVDRTARPTQARPARVPSFLAEEVERVTVERPVFVTRERELARLDGFLASALGGQGQIAFVTGGAGRGKTALMAEFARRAQEAHPDLLVVLGNCDAHVGAADPYLPFRDCMGMLTGDVEGRWAAGAITEDHARRLWEMMPSVVEAVVEHGPGLLGVIVPARDLYTRATDAAPSGAEWLARLEELTERASAKPGSLPPGFLFEQFVKMLHDVSSQAPMVLVLDDLQWTDAASVNLLLHLGRHIAGSRILVLGAYRPDEVSLGRDGEPHPLAMLLPEFKRRFGDVQVDLTAADEREGDRFIHAFLDAEPNRLGRDFRSGLLAHTRGHPLFTIELLRELQERRGLVLDEDGRWVEAEGIAWDVLPARVEGVIEKRIGRLTPELRDILSVASVEGEAFTAQVVARVQGIGERELLRALTRELGARHRLVMEREETLVGHQLLSRYRFAHALFQRYVYDSLGVGERRLLHREVGEALEDLYAGHTGEVLAQLARHFELGGVPTKAIDYLRQVGDRAHRLYANREAVGYYERALDLLATLASDDSGREWRATTETRLHEGLGDALHILARYEEAEAAFERALASVPADESIWRARLHRKIGDIYNAIDRPEDGLQAYDRAEAALGPEAPEAPLDWWREWLDIQIHGRGVAYACLALVLELSNILEDAQPLLEKYGAPAERAWFLRTLIWCNLMRDRWVTTDETRELTRALMAMSEETGSPFDMAWARYFMGVCQLCGGELDLAKQELQASLVLGEQAGHLHLQAMSLTALNVLSRKRGAVDEVRRHPRQGLDRRYPVSLRFYIATSEANLAWLAWREGDLPEAESQAHAAVGTWDATSWVTEKRWLALWPLIAVMLARDRVSEAVAHARPLLDETQERMPEAVERQVEGALAAWDGGEAELARERLARAVELAEETGYL